jgi:hypothetical protein
MQEGLAQRTELLERFRPPRFPFTRDQWGRTNQNQNGQRNAESCEHDFVSYESRLRGRFLVSTLSRANGDSHPTRISQKNPKSRKSMIQYILRPLVECEERQLRE